MSTWFFNWKKRQLHPREEEVPEEVDLTEEMPEEMGEIFSVVEMNPLFPGCTEERYVDRQACSITLMHNYFYDELGLPRMVYHNSNAPMAIFRFIVEKDGSISEPTVFRSAKLPELEEQFLDVLSNMPAWEPAIQRGKPARFLYTLPLRLKEFKED